MSPVISVSIAAQTLTGLYIITDERLGGGHLAMARAALHGGARIVQLRDKTTPRRELLKIAQEMRHLTAEAGAVFLINDSLELALLCDADGVHLGPDDWPPAEARRVLGATAIIGISCGTVEEAEAAQGQGATYVGAGAVFGTTTKSDAGAPIGLEGLRRIVAATPLPVAGIGGVNRENAGRIPAQGAAMTCVISAIACAGDEAAMTRATEELCQILSNR